MDELICRNARTLKKGGSLIICEPCEKIIGYLNCGCYRSLMLMFACKCGCKGSLEYNYLPRSASQPVNKPLVSNDGLFKCSACGMPLFSLKTSELKYFAGSITCKCGAEYTHLKLVTKEQGLHM